MVLKWREVADCSRCVKQCQWKALNMATIITTNNNSTDINAELTQKLIIENAEWTICRRLVAGWQCRQVRHKWTLIYKHNRLYFSEYAQNQQWTNASCFDTAVNTNLYNSVSSRGSQIPLTHDCKRQKMNLVPSSLDVMFKRARQQSWNWLPIPQTGTYFKPMTMFSALACS